MQQIPRSSLDIKPMFVAPKEKEEIIDVLDKITLKYDDELETLEGWKKAKILNIGDIIKGEDHNIIINNIEKKLNTICISIK